MLTGCWVLGKAYSSDRMFPLRGQNFDKFWVKILTERNAHLASMRQSCLSLSGEAKSFIEETLRIDQSVTERVVAQIASVKPFTVAALLGLPTLYLYVESHVS
jgi:hypothetical protein